MELDVRTNQLLLEILSNPDETSTSLKKRHGLTRSQLGYSLKKINEFLDEMGQRTIKRTSNGHFIVAKTIIEEFSQLNSQVKVETYLSPEERSYLLILMLLAKTEELSMNHFTIELEVSKNTIARDFKELKPLLSSYQLKLEYIRAKGYRIVGNEWNRRQLLIEAIDRIHHFDDEGHLLLHYGEISLTEVAAYRNKVVLLEERLNIRYSDDKVTDLPILILLFKRRIKRGKKISYEFDFDFDVAELQATKEYKEVKEIFFKEDAIDVNEVIYFTLLFLSTNLTQMDILSAGEQSTLCKAVDQVIHHFEKIAHITIVDKKALLKRIMIHMRPAYYRIKYHMHLAEIDINRQENREVASVFYLTKKSIAPLEDFFRQKISDTEIFYLALFFGSHLLDNNSSLYKKRQKAIIVCTNGISISLLLERMLTGIFPEIDFMATLSLRDFYHDKMDYDLVFSSVPLKTKKKFYLVKDFLTDEGKLQLRQKVMNDTVIGMDENGLAHKIVANLAEQTFIPDKEKLFLDILDFLKESTTEGTIPVEHTRHFDQLIPHNCLLVEDQKVSWHEALSRMSTPLIEQKIITPNYLAALKKEMAAIPPYIVFRHQLALPHTEPEKGALGVALSFGIFKKGIITEEGDSIHFIMLLASNNKEKHIDALLEIMDLAGRQEILSKLLSTKDEKQVWQILRSYRMSYWG